MKLRALPPARLLAVVAPISLVGVTAYVAATVTFLRSPPGTTELLEILACPDDHHAPVREEGDYLVCTECRRRFPVRDGIPVMLLEEALPPA